MNQYKNKKEDVTAQNGQRLTNNLKNWILKYIFLHNHDVTTRPNKFSTNSLMFFNTQAIFKCPLSAPQIFFTAGLSQLGKKSVCDRNMEKYYNCKI